MQWTNIGLPSPGYSIMRGVADATKIGVRIDGTRHFKFFVDSNQFYSLKNSAFKRAATTLVSTDDSGWVWPTPVDSIKIKQINVTGLADSLNARPTLSAANTLYKSISYVPAWTDITGKPSFATVATSGLYSDLAGTPTIPAAQVNSDWNSPSGPSQIINKPTIVPADSIMTVNRATDSIASIMSNVNGKVPQSRTLTIQGVSQDLSANRTWNPINGTGFVKASGTTVTYDNSTYLTVEVDGSVTNEIELPSQSGQSGRILSTNGTSPSWIAQASSPGLNNAVAYSAGAVYNITTTSQRLDFGTTDPVITIPAAGTYLIMSNVRVDYSGLTNLAANTVNIKLRRTNNTAADLTNATGDFVVPAVTLLTATGGDCDVNAILYTTTNNNDVIEVWGSRSASISVGNIQAGNAWIMALRVY